MTILRSKVEIDFIHSRTSDETAPSNMLPEPLVSVKKISQWRRLGPMTVPASASNWVQLYHEEDWAWIKHCIIQNLSAYTIDVKWTDGEVGVESDTSIQTLETMILSDIGSIWLKTGANDCIVDMWLAVSGYDGDPTS